MELNVIKITIWILPGVQFKQSYLSECRVRGDGSACRHVLTNKFDAIQVIESAYDLLARGGIILRVPIFLRISGKLHDLLNISIGPDAQSARQVIWFEFGVFCQQVAQVIEQAIGLSLGRGLRHFGVVAPFAEVGRWHDRRYFRAFFGNDKAAGDSEQVGVVAIAFIEVIDIAMIDGEGAKKDRRFLALT